MCSPSLTQNNENDDDELKNEDIKENGYTHSNYDKSKNRVPFREIFVNLHIIKTAFRKNVSMNQNLINSIIRWHKIKISTKGLVFEEIATGIFKRI